MKLLLRRLKLPFKNEAAFGHAFDDALEAEGWDVHNIQTPTTERGCPDRFIQNRIGLWIELKNIKVSIKTPMVYIPYRPGQQSWLYKHYKHGGLGFTMTAGEDGFLLFKNLGILSGKIYQHGKWPELIMSHLYSKTLSDWLLQWAR